MLSEFIVTVLGGITIAAIIWAFNKLAKFIRERFF